MEREVLADLCQDDPVLIMHNASDIILRETLKEERVLRPERLCEVWKDHVLATGRVNQGFGCF